MLIEVGQEEILDSVVPPSMDNQRSLIATMTNIERMMLLARRHHDKRITQCAQPVQTVNPRFGIRIAVEQHVVA